MTKYKIVSLLNFLIGLSLFIFPFIQLIFVIPKLSTLYEDIGVQPNLITLYSGITGVIVMGVFNIFFGIKLWSNQTENKEKYFKYGIILAIATFFLGGIMVGFIVSSIVFPIYNFTSPLK